MFESFQAGSDDGGLQPSDGVVLESRGIGEIADHASAAAARRASASMSSRRLWSSVATAGGQRDFAGFPAVGAIV